MIILTQVFGWMAALLHVVFFCLESLLWQNPEVMKSFHQEASQAASTALMAFNQGFYNLFLAIGMAIGLVLLTKKNPTVGKTLVFYISAVMLGAALVLLYSAPQMLRGVLAQGVPALLTIICLASSKE